MFGVAWTGLDYAVYINPNGFIAFEKGLWLIFVSLHSHSSCHPAMSIMVVMLMCR
jgi:hypothetical protein